MTLDAIGLICIILPVFVLRRSVAARWEER